MKYLFATFVAITITAVLLSPVVTSAQQKMQKIRFETEPLQEVNVPYRLFKTENMWTMLLLDTRDGRVWQIQYSIEEKAPRIKLPINDIALVLEPEKKIGRFTLYRTENMWTFLLLDQYDGRVFQCQFCIDEDERFITRIFSSEEKREAQAAADDYIKSVKLKREADKRRLSVPK